MIGWFGINAVLGRWSRSVVDGQAIAAVLLEIGKDDQQVVDLVFLRKGDLRREQPFVRHNLRAEEQPKFGRL